MSDTHGNGPDIHLPDEIMSVIPTDPYDQLDLARKITSIAIASRVTKLESETGRLRQHLYDKDRLILELQDKVSQLEQAYHDADLRLNITREDNLETFKRQLMQSLNDDDSSQVETVDIGTCDSSVPKSAYPSTGKETNGYTTHHSFSGSTESTDIMDDASKQTVQRFSMTPYIMPQFTPSGTPKIISTSGSPRRYSAAGSPQRTSGTTSPTMTQYEGRGGLSSWYPSSQQSSAASSPPLGRPMPARTPRVDGKEFFRQARSRLSYEQFSAFLANIKELNAQKQSREETLRKAEEIFGMDNKDLYLSFQGLLNRNIH